MSAIPHKIVLASAGTGKTHALTSRYIGLLARGVPPARVLALTFTRKAAGEIHARILSRLVAAAEDGARARELAGHAGVGTLDPDRAAGLLATFAGASDVAPIGTIDSFVVRLALGSSHDLGLPAGWRVAEEDEDAALRERALARTLDHADRRELLTLVRVLGSARFTARVRDALLEAVRGAHEAFVNAPASAWEATRTLDRDEPLDNAALAQAIEALRKIEPVTTKAGTVSKAWTNAHEAAVERARCGEWEEFVGGGIAAKVAAGETTFSRMTIPAGAIRAYRPLVDHARACLLREQAEFIDALRDLLRAFDVAYRQLQDEHGLVRFDDLPRWILDASTHPALDLYYRLDARVDHVLLDEFQDTSIAQLGVLRPILEEIVAGGPGIGDAPAGRSVFVVGDPKQSLYQWRQAEPDLLPALRDEWQDRVGVAALRENRRSVPVIIEAVNRVFGTIHENPTLADHHEAARAWKTQFPEHEAIRAGEGHVRLEAVARGTGAAESAHRLEQAAAERAASIARAHPDATVALLVRTRKPIPRLVHRLGVLGIDASEEGGNPLTDSPAVMLVLSLLRAMEHPDDRAARFHVASSPLGPEVGLHDWRDDVEARRALSVLRERLAERGLAEEVSRFTSIVRPHASGRDAVRLGQLVDLADGFGLDPSGGLDRFRRVVERRRVEGPGGGRVRVLTIHAAKGLEFDAVVLLDLDHRLLGAAPAIHVARPTPLDEPDAVLPRANEVVRALSPDLRAAHDAWVTRRVREELSVLYVAMTRARRALDVLTLAPAREETTPAAILRGALAPDAPPDQVGVLFEAGAPNWPAERGPASAPSRTRVEGPITFLARRGRSPRPGRPEHRRRSVAAVPWIHSRGVDRGLLVHAWLDRLAWIEDGMPGEDERDAVAREAGIRDPGVVAEAWAMFRRTIADGAVRALLSWAGTADRLGTRGLEVLRELPVATDERDGVVLGRIDRVVIAFEHGRPIRAEVIDFKTEAVDGPVETAVDRHRDQLEGYRRAVAKCAGLPPHLVAARLALLSIGRVVDLPAPVE